MLVEKLWSTICDFFTIKPQQEERKKFDVEVKRATPGMESEIVIRILPLNTADKKVSDEKAVKTDIMNGKYYVGTYEEDIVSVVKVEIIDKTLQIVHLASAKPGGATALLKHLEELCFEKRIHTIWCWVPATEAQWHEVFESLGFKANYIGRLWFGKQYYYCGKEI